MRVLVTGGAGLVGSTVVDRLLAADHAVTVVDNLSTGKLHHLADARRGDRPFGFVRLDTTSDGLERAVAKAEPEVVLHLAANLGDDDPVREALVSVVGTVNLLEACRLHGVGKVVVAAASDLYGDLPGGAPPVDEDHPVRPTSTRGTNAVAVEAHLRASEARHGLRWTSLVLGTVYGPRQDPSAGLVAALADRMADGRDVTVPGDGEQTRDLVAVGDVADALVAALDGGDGARINVATGRPTTVNALVALLAELSGHARPASHGPPPAGERRHEALAVDRAEALLGWTPTTDLRDGLAATLAWFGG
jgi:UDP-glucose 4-epimerase